MEPSNEIDQDVIQKSVSTGILLGESLYELILNENWVASHLVKYVSGKSFIEPELLREVIAEGVIHAHKKIGSDVYETKDVLRAAGTCVSSAWNKLFKDSTNYSKSGGKYSDVWVETNGVINSKLSTNTYSVKHNDSKVFYNLVEDILGRDAFLYFKLRAKGYKDVEINKTLSINGENKTIKYRNRAKRNGALRKIYKAYSLIV